uniref:C2H2-type domain-containing protein n=1 Tax=Heliothis virescens TaxID=7102 RepID=A0A2A4J4K7_HELVI
METEDDMIVLVVVDDDDEKAKGSENNSVSEPSVTSDEVKNIIEAAQKHGEYIQVRQEPADDEYQYDYLEEDFKFEVKEEPINTEYDDGDEDYIPEETSCTRKYDKHRFSMLKPWQQRSFVAELRENYEELQEDEELLVYTLGRIMKAVRPPLPPNDFFIMNETMFECVHCEYLSDTVPAAGRHYQEKHGPRYLVCYACGVDFRSTTNLYKHEKRCIAPDAEIVLRARAIFLGRKGRSRPYLTRNKFSIKNEDEPRKSFPCELCPAVFITKSNLESHENLHRGERPFRCHVCPCAYTSYSALSRHTKKHSNVQFTCDHCGRSFKIKAALVAHMDTHKPYRKHGCEECNRRFAQKSALMLHVNKVHRNLPPPCACQICPKRYPRMSLLKAHMKRAHGMTIITRKMFFKTLPTMSDLEVKQSKVILKYDENAMIGLPKAEQFVPEDPYQENYDGNYVVFKRENYIDNNIEDTEKTEQISMEEFMQYIGQNVQDSDARVVYVQNGEVMHMDGGNSDIKDIIVHVEQLPDGLNPFVEAKIEPDLVDDTSLVIS